MHSEVLYEFLSPSDPALVSLVGPVNSLLSQLSDKARPVNSSHLESVVKLGRFLGAFKEGELVGMATLVLVVIPTGLSGIIHDVVVDQSMRNQGLGRELVVWVYKEAQKLGLRYVELTSHSSRVAANKLYQSLGFDQRQTNVYRKNC